MRCPSEYQTPSGLIVHCRRSREPHTVHVSSVSRATGKRWVWRAPGDPLPMEAEGVALPVDEEEGDARGKA